MDVTQYSSIKRVSGVSADSKLMFDMGYKELDASDLMGMGRYTVNRSELNIDNQTKRLSLIEHLPDECIRHIFFMLDVFDGVECVNNYWKSISLTIKWEWRICVRAMGTSISHPRGGKISKKNSKKNSKKKIVRKK